ncbi:phosphate ABC transporter permease PstA [Alkalicaulis satelles]|uniref:Phosphate transport system permease protein PstA n=1 Tax=Alkalicaulis satelles TaxID=2609175 RepID=A0A5M6ZJH0_9PROT|nr:phosphate ABC transporter permease PstA [Alkalicaulis satelles]KAA5804962.1 phosphate ABC transporter permease PstA [Alkalicaulis satelles]
MNRPASIRTAVEARLARRHRAERRFQFYGAAAICLAVAFLALLIGSILIQSVPAMTTWRMTLQVELDRAAIDPRGDMSEASLRRGGYNAAIQQALRDQFPDVEDRAELRELFGLYSSVNAARLLNRVVQDPSLVGGTVSFTFPIDDDADLYLKGVSVRESRAPGPAPVRIQAGEGRAVTLSAEARVFDAFVDDVREAARERARILEQRAERAEAALADAIDRDIRAIYEAEARRARAQAERLRDRLDEGAPVVIGPQIPSLLVQVDGAVIRVSDVSADRRSARGEMVISAPLGEAAHSDWTLWTIETPQAGRLISDRQIAWVDALRERGMTRSGFNTELFTYADSREPELAGVLGALIGSVLTMFVTMLLAVPIGVGAAIYLEEFAPKNRITQLIEVNINNLAAVPSIVFGLLGLAVFINTFGLPRSAPLVGGIVLALMTLPTVIISSRAALKAVPPSIREAALGVGASKTQAVFHHVLPLAAPGILTGSIIGLAQALGETAPLLMIGMVAFIADAPSLGLAGFTEPSTVMPVQIFLWSSAAERAFEARTAAAILVLLTLMVSLNAAAIYLRRRFERRW